MSKKIRPDYFYNPIEGCSCCKYCGVRKRTEHKLHCPIAVAERAKAIQELINSTFTPTIELEYTELRTAA
jgi:hypothetical protein